MVRLTICMPALYSTEDAISGRFTDLLKRSRGESRTVHVSESPLELAQDLVVGFMSHVLDDIVRIIRRC